MWEHNYGPGAGKHKKLGKVEDNAWAVMREVVDRLTEAGHVVWLSAGTILGLHRDGGFIPHDTDVDFGFLSENNNPISLDEIKEILHDYELLVEVLRQGIPTQLALVKDDVLVDIYFFYKGIDHGFAVNRSTAGTMRKPLKFVDPPAQVEYNGSLYPVPSPVEEYLTYRYKDWKTPTGGKSEWVNDVPKGFFNG